VISEWQDKQWLGQQITSTAQTCCSLTSNGVFTRWQWRILLYQDHTDPRSTARQTVTVKTVSQQTLSIEVKWLSLHYKVWQFSNQNYNVHEYTKNIPIQDMFLTFLANNVHSNNITVPMFHIIVCITNTYLQCFFWGGARWSGTPPPFFAQIWNF